ncbi:hypothetical protein ACF0H5_006355 [Mactra antiquata]
MYSPLSHIDQNMSWTPEQLSRIKAEELTGSVVYLCVLMLLGIVGNSCVFIIFYLRFSASTHRCFILVLAFFDLFACAVGAPWAISESFFAFNYLDEVSCKIFRFILYYTCIASSLTLVLIAFERHRKICTPLKQQFTIVMAKRASFVVAGVISFLSASPAFILYGNSSVDTGVSGVVGTKCFIKDYFEKDYPAYPRAFNIYLLCLAFVATLIMSVCYIRIARQVSRMGKDNIAKRSRKLGNNLANEDTSCSNDVLTDDQDTSAYKSKIKPSPSQLSSADKSAFRDCKSSSNGSVNDIVKENRSTGMPRQNSNKSTLSASGNIKRTVKERTSLWASKLMRRLSTTHGRKTIRITKMLTVVTVAFVISYLPHLTLMIWSLFLTPENKNTLATDNRYQIMFYSFLINNLVNPFIYAAMDLKFRTELKKLLKCQMSLVKHSTFRK